MTESDVKKLVRRLLEGKVGERAVVRRLLAEMSRGGRILVVDETNLGLDSELAKKNYTVETVPVGMKDEDIKRKFLGARGGRVFITRNGADFWNPDDLQRYYYGLIWVHADIDAKILAKKIERELMRANFAAVLTQVRDIYK